MLSCDSHEAVEKGLGGGLKKGPLLRLVGTMEDLEARRGRKLIQTLIGVLYMSEWSRQ